MSICFRAPTRRRRLAGWRLPAVATLLIAIGAAVGRGNDAAEADAEPAEAAPAKESQVEESPAKETSGQKEFGQEAGGRQESRRGQGQEKEGAAAHRGRRRPQRPASRLADAAVVRRGAGPVASGRVRLRFRSRQAAGCPGEIRRQRADQETDRGRRPDLLLVKQISRYAARLRLGPRPALAISNCATVF